MSRDSFGSYSTPLNASAESPHRESFGSFQEYKIDSIQSSMQSSAQSPTSVLEVLTEEILTESPIVARADIISSASAEAEKALEDSRESSIADEMSKFTHEKIFCQATGDDPVLNALKKCFSFEELVGMNSRNLMTLDEADKLGQDPLEILVNSQSWFAVIQYTM